jgi:hypothetical protein
MTLKELETRTNKGGFHKKSFAVILSDLKQVLMADGTRERAIRHAGISNETFYRWLKESNEFKEEIEGAEDFMHKLTERVILDAVKEGNADLALKWKDRRDKGRYSTKVEQEHTGTLTIRPISYSDINELDAPEDKKEILHEPTGT